MELGREQIDYVAHLARIELTDEERTLFGSQLAGVLDYVEKLNELNTETVPPTAHVMGLSNVFRDDVARPSPPREVMLANAPQQACGCFLVPKILD